MIPCPSARGPAPLRQSAGKEVAHCTGNFRGVSLQREVSSIKKAHDRARIVAFERLGTRRQEERIVFAPYSQETRFVGAEIRLEGWVKGDVALVLTKKVGLRFLGAGPAKEKVMKGIAAGGNKGGAGSAVGYFT